MSKEKTNKERENKEIIITPELAKKLSNLSKGSKKRTFFGRVNPLIIIVTVIVSFFLFVGFYSQTSSLKEISLGELVAGLENNNYSELLIQNDGSIVARNK